MAHVTIMESIRLRFPGRDEAFHVGVEVGMLATLMALPLPSFSRRVSPAAADQVISLAPKLGYRVEATHAEPDEDGTPRIEVSLRLGIAEPAPAPRRPALRLVGGADVA